MQNQLTANDAVQIRVKFHMLMSHLRVVSPIMRLSAVAFCLASVPQALNGREALSSTILDRDACEFISRAEEATFNEYWALNDSLCDDYLLRHPQSFLPNLLQAAAIEARAFAEEDGAQDDTFHALIDSATHSLELRVAGTVSARDSAVCFYFLGNARSHHALWEAKFGSRFSAIGKGMKAREYYDRAIAADSSFMDSRAGLGSYLYWKSAKTGFMHWTGLVDDERALGIAELLRAQKDALVSRNSARSALIWVYLNEKRYRDASVLAEEMQSAFPNGLTFLWPLAVAYRDAHQYPQALDAYLEIRSRLLASPGNHFNLLSVDYEILKLARTLEDTATAKMVANSFDSYRKNLPKETRRKAPVAFTALLRQ